MNEDVVSNILEYVYYTPSGTPNRQQLAICSAISRVWRYPSQRLLFHHIIINEEISWECIMTLFHSKTPHRKQVLQWMVHILEFPKKTPDDQFNDQWETRLPVIMQLLPSLYELRLDIVDLDSLKSTTTTALESTPRLRALVITMHDSISQSAEDSIVPVQLLHIRAWKLRFLALKGSAFNLSTLMARANHHELYSLQITDPSAWDISDEYSEELLTWLLSNSQHSLRRLSLEIVYRCLQPFLSNLHSISYHSIDYKLREPHHNPVMYNFPSLKELIRPNAYLRAAGNYFLDVPPSVSHLMLSVYVVGWTDIHLMGYLEVIPPRIRILSLIVSQESWRPSQLVLDAYSSKNIDIRIVFNEVYEIIEMDRIESTIYPVGRTLKVIGAMSQDTAIANEQDI